MMAQALGRGDRPEARRSFFLNLTVALALAGAFTVACALWPAGVMRLYTDDAQTVAEAAAYLAQAMTAYFGKSFRSGPDGIEI